MTQQEAYVELSRVLQEMEVLMKLANDIAKEHDLVLVQRYLGSLPETLDPSRLDVVEKPYKDWKGVDRVQRIKSFKDDDPDYPGEDLYRNWIPSNLC